MKKALNKCEKNCCRTKQFKIKEDMKNYLFLQQFENMNNKKDIHLCLIHSEKKHTSRFIFIIHPIEVLATNNSTLIHELLFFVS